MTLKEQFQVNGGYKTWSLGLTAVGVLSIVIGFFVYGTGDEMQQSRFWGAMLHNSVYFLLVVNSAMFFICATTLAMGGWQMGFRRVSEAISVCVIPLGIIAFIVLMSLVFSHLHVYEWVHPHGDKVLEAKSGFLNPMFFTVYTILTIGLWIVLGRKMRSLSNQLDEKPVGSVEEGKRYIFTTTIWASLYIVWFALTVASVTPWIWLMSINAHWYSTMFSWYTFASAFVAGIALITLFVIYLKNQGYLEVVNDEHLQDLGKFMFAFSIFWTYLWFSQFMLIWYANIPEETVYFKPRLQGVYKGIFWLNFIINFLAPLLILMRRNSKRNYATMTFMAVLILFGHWLDFYQITFAGLFPDHVNMNIFDFGVAIFFLGVIMFVTGRELSKRSLYVKNHPFFKESIIHHA